MKTNKGFTLTEILLAVMIVGLIGVALASLTTTATRETTTGRSRITLRNSLSLALRQIRQDIHESSQVLYVKGVIDPSETEMLPLLVLGKNVRMSGESILTDQSVQYIAYCFNRGTTTKLSNGANVLPSQAVDGGTIYRREFSEKPTDISTVCSATGRRALLHNVKFIPSSSVTADNYPVPFFGLKDYSNERKTNDMDFLANAYESDIASRLYIYLIVELPIAPVVNEVAEEMFALPNGFEVIGD